MYRYGKGWKFRFVYTSFLGGVAVVGVSYFMDIQHDGPMKALALFWTVSLLSWLFTVWRDPYQFNIDENGITFSYYLKPSAFLAWNDITGINHLKLNKTMNGFGQDELEIMAKAKNYQIVKHLVNYNQFESEVLKRVKS